MIHTLKENLIATTKERDTLKNKVAIQRKQREKQESALQTKHKDLRTA